MIAKGSNRSYHILVEEGSQKSLKAAHLPRPLTKRTLNLRSNCDHNSSAVKATGSSKQRTSKEAEKHERSCSALSVTEASFQSLRSRALANEHSCTSEDMASVSALF